MLDFCFICKLKCQKLRTPLASLAFADIQIKRMKDDFNLLYFKVSD